MRLSREAAISEMARGGLLYVYVENEDRMSTEPRHPVPGSGAIVGDYGLSHIGRQTVSAIRRLGVEWCNASKALKLSEAGRRRVAHGKSPIWFWSD